MGPFDGVIRYKGEFDYHGLYTLMKDFFTSRGYDWYESKYKDKGDEAEFKWNVEKKYDDHHTVIFKLEAHMWEYKKIESVVHGKRITKVSARIQIVINGEAKTNLDKIYGKNSGKINNLLKSIHKKIVQREQDEHWDVIQLSLQHDFIDTVKTFLGMKGN